MELLYCVLTLHWKSSKLQMNDQDAVLSTRMMECPACTSRVEAEPSPQEWHEMMEEARQRMLKTEKVSLALKLIDAQ